MSSGRQEFSTVGTFQVEPTPGADGQDFAGNLQPPARYLVLRGFKSRFLPRPRDLYVYLPEAYLSEPARRFPVLYLNDGQNLMDGQLSYVVNQTWRAHAAAESLTSKGLIEPLILVGIGNTGRGRMLEYTPTRDPRYGGGEGARYGRLLLEELLPLIRGTFRTLDGPQHTGLGGSSLGGLISLGLGLDRPDVYGRLAVLSPSVWWDHRSLLEAVNHVRIPGGVPLPRIWLSMGTGEGLRHLRDTDLLDRRLVARGWRPGVDLRYVRTQRALHNEAAWANRFGETLEFLFPVTRK